MSRETNGSYLWADVSKQTVEHDRSIANGRPRDAFGHVNPNAKQERHYEGHVNDGSGVQAHSCGANYPYVIGQQETGLEDGSVHWFVIGGRLGNEPKVLFDTHARVQDYIDWLKAGDTLVKQDASDRREGKHVSAAIQLAIEHRLGNYLSALGH